MKFEAAQIHTKFQTVQIPIKLDLVVRVYVPVNSYGHVETVNLPNLIFSWAILTTCQCKWLNRTSCTYFQL